MNWNDLIYRLDLRPSQVKELQYYLENFPVTEDLFTDEFIDELTWKNEDYYASYIGRISLIKYLEKELNEPLKGDIYITFSYFNNDYTIELENFGSQKNKIKKLINKLGLEC